MNNQLSTWQRQWDPSTCGLGERERVCVCVCVCLSRGNYFFFFLLFAVEMLPLKSITSQVVEMQHNLWSDFIFINKDSENTKRFRIAEVINQRFSTILSMLDCFGGSDVNFERKNITLIALQPSLTINLQTKKSIQEPTIKKVLFVTTIQSLSLRLRLLVGLIVT